MITRNAHDRRCFDTTRGMVDIAALMKLKSAGSKMTPTWTDTHLCADGCAAPKKPSRRPTKSRRGAGEVPQPTFAAVAAASSSVSTPGSSSGAPPPQPPGMPPQHGWGERMDVVQAEREANKRPRQAPQ